MSGVSLFIALSKSLPQKVAVLGLDLSKNETMTGWFLLAVTVYILINFIIFSIVEIVQYYLPVFIDRKTANTTGNTIGLTAEECFLYQKPNDNERGTTSSEMKEINIKNERITYQYKRNLIKTSNYIKLTTEFAFPVLFGIVSLSLLCVFLINIQ